MQLLVCTRRGRSGSRTRTLYQADHEQHGCKSYFTVGFRFRHKASPAKPEPSSTIVEGSGTASVVPGVLGIATNWIASKKSLSAPDGPKTRSILTVLRHERGDILLFYEMRWVSGVRLSLVTLDSTDRVDHGEVSKANSIPKRCRIYGLVLKGLLR